MSLASFNGLYEEFWDFFFNVLATIVLALNIYFFAANSFE